MHCFSVCMDSLIYIKAIVLRSSHRIHRVLVSGPPWIPRSDDTQVLCIKRRSTVSPAHPWIQNPWIQRTDFYVSFHLLPFFSSTVFKTHPCHCANMEPTASNWCNKLQGVHPLNRTSLLFQWWTPRTPAATRGSAINILVPSPLGTCVRIHLVDFLIIG